MAGDLVQDVHKEHRPRKAGAKVIIEGFRGLRNCCGIV